jgi:hypothetical protein
VSGTGKWRAALTGVRYRRVSGADISGEFVDGTCRARDGHDADFTRHCEPRRVSIHEPTPA